MDLEFLKRIPILKDMDLTQPAARRRLALMLIGVAMVIAVIVAKIATASGVGRETSAADPVEQTYRTPNIDIPKGEDRDVVGTTSMIAARENGRRGGRDLYNQGRGDEGDDPYSSIKRNAPREDTTESRSIRDLAREAFGVEPHVTPADAQPKEEPKAAEESVETPRPRKVAVSRPAQKNPSPEPRKEEKKTEEPAEQTQTPEPVKVRRTGGVSSLSDDWGTVAGIGSLESGEEYVVQDDDKPYKVMFLRDQKVKSGERVTLRLLEDMVTDGVLIPRNTHLSAVCEIGDRLRISVTNIEIGGKIYNLDYVAFDNDGAEGLYCPESNAGRKANQAGQSAGQAAISAVTGLVAATAGSMAGNAARIGAEAVRGSGGNVTANISSGYTFYLLKR